MLGVRAGGVLCVIRDLACSGWRFTASQGYQSTSAVTLPDCLLTRQLAGPLLGLLALHEAMEAPYDASMLDHYYNPAQAALAAGLEVSAPATGDARHVTERGARRLGLHRSRSGALWRSGVVLTTFSAARFASVHMHACFRGAASATLRRRLTCDAATGMQARSTLTRSSCAA